MPDQQALAEPSIRHDSLIELLAQHGVRGATNDGTSASPGSRA